MHRRLFLPTLLALVTAMALGSLAAAAPLGALTEFNANPGSIPFRIASGADGNLWFSDQGSPKAIDRMTLSGAIQAFTLPATSVPRQVRVGSDGNLWFTDTSTVAPAPAIGRVNPDGTISEFSLRTGSVPNALALGADGNLWFTDKSLTSPAIGRLNPDGTADYFSVGLNAGSLPNGITPAGDGFLWFTDQGSTKAIGRIKTNGTPAEIGTIQEFSANLNAGSNPAAITTAKDGTLWFTDQGTPRAIGHVTTSGTITESSAQLIAGSRPIEITPGADGNLWFTDDGTTTPANPAIGRVTPNAAGWTIDYFPLPGTHPGGVRTGADGNLWFLDNVVGAQKIARFGVGAPAASIGIAVVGSRNAGSPQVCNDAWSDWAGQQPSRTAFGFDGYQWLLDGVAIAGATSQSYTPTAADVGHQLSCKVTVTYTLFPTTVSATSAAVQVKGAAEQLADLGDAVEGVGPGKSLGNKLNEAQAALDRNDLAGACSILGAFVHEVNAQTGKKISPSTAASLIAAATRIETLLGC